jgi:hypothetical protein
VQLVILPDDKIGNPLDTNMLLWMNPRSVGSPKLAQPWGSCLHGPPRVQKRGRLGHTSGPGENDKLCGSSSVMPHLTTFMLNTKSLSLPMKQSFQRPSLSVYKSNGVQISGYHSDNGFQGRRIHEGTPPKGQGIKFSGVGPSGRMELLRTQSRLSLGKLGH